MYRYKIMLMNLIEQLTVKQSKQSAVPTAYTCAAENQRPAVRDEFNERELSILSKLDETRTVRAEVSKRFSTD